MSPEAQNLMPSLVHAIHILSPKLLRSRQMRANSADGIFTTHAYAISCGMQNIVRIHNRLHPSDVKPGSSTAYRMKNHPAICTSVVWRICIHHDVWYCDVTVYVMMWTGQGEHPAGGKGVAKKKKIYITHWKRNMWLAQTWGIILQKFMVKCAIFSS